jgi:5-bromo-4-chloroindolyl phosphate hydrolysis protein
MAAEPVRYERPTVPLTVPPPLPPVVSRARAKASVVKSAALFLLPLPLVFAILRGLMLDDTGRLVVAATALACFWAAGSLAWRALTAEARYLLGDQPDLPSIPWKLVSALLTALGTALSATAGGHTVAGAATFAALGALGHVCFYGRDLKAPRVTITEVAGVDVVSVADQHGQAERRLRRIDAAAHAIAVPEFRERLGRITQIGRDILAKIARDPRDATKARRFLHLYLDSTERVTEEYSRTHAGVRTASLEENFRQLLIEMEKTFADQHRRLLENDALSLDVEIEVLNARLKQEGVGDYLEKRS